MKNLLARLNKELQEKNQQPKQRLIDLELADYEKTIKTLKDDLTHKDKEIQDLRDDLTNLNEKHLSLKQEIENLEQQKSQTEERANKFKTLLDTTKKELQDAKDLEEERHHNDDNVRILIDKLQIELDTNKVTISQLLSDKQQLTGKLFQGILF
jgi:chromosome segregation ATPase